MIMISRNRFIIEYYIISFEFGWSNDNRRVKILRKNCTRVQLNSSVVSELELKFSKSEIEGFLLMEPKIVKYQSANLNSVQALIL